MANDVLGRDQRIAAYRTMRTIREFEERVHERFAAGDLPGAVHLYVGQEAVAAGVCAALADDDYIASTHRGHGHAIAKGCDLTGMMAEIYGKATGLCGGKGGSMHIADFDRGMLGANGVAAGGVPLACGAALSAKLRESGQVAVAFVVEDNGYAQSTGTRFHLGGRSIAARAEAVGMPAVVVDGYDFFAVNAATTEAVDRARAGGGPSLVECKAQRFFGHMEGWDHQAYRGAGEVDALWAEHDCLRLLADRLVADGSVAPAELAEVDSAVRADVDFAVEEARAAKEPTVDQLLADVYVGH